MTAYLDASKLRVFHHLLDQVLWRLTAFYCSAGRSSLRNQSAFQLLRGLETLVSLETLDFLLYGFVFFHVSSEHSDLFVLMFLEVEAESSAKAA
jgi:hypothetical protein